ncbi:MAG: hypothetical protein EAX96_16940 [Candidatus Lokiarchaeota archaeon]|nr:hypothetical protein [Candidatus Lokiarchaeota archaeon]
MKYLTKSQFVEKLHRNIQLFFSRKDMNLQNQENKERLSRFINEYFKLYNFRCEDIKLVTKKNKISLRLKKLQRGKSSELINLIFN